MNDYGRKDSLQSEHESQKVEIFFSARKLADLDLLTVTDSFLVVYKQESNAKKQQVLKTKIYWNDLNPDYAETLVTEFYFEGNFCFYFSSSKINCLALSRSFTTFFSRHCGSHYWRSIRFQIQRTEERYNWQEWKLPRRTYNQV